MQRVADLLKKSYILLAIISKKTKNKNNNHLYTRNITLHWHKNTNNKCAVFFLPFAPSEPVHDTRSAHS